MAPPLPDDLSLRDYLDLRLFPLERLSDQVGALGAQITTIQVALAGTISRPQHDELIARIGSLEQQMALQRGIGAGSRAAWATVVGIATVVSGVAGGVIGSLLHH